MISMHDVFRCRRPSFLLSFLFLTLPASTNYQLHDFGMGSGGSANVSSSNYSANVISGESGSGNLSSSQYNLGSGLEFAQQADVPGAPTFTNPSNYYNKLQLALNVSENPSDTVFAVAISSDNFTSDTRYVQSDATVGATLGVEDYQTYTAWGGSSGFSVIGLVPGTTYSVKVKAMQGKFSETGYGPVATASTVNPSMTFGISTPIVNFGELTVNMVNDGPQDVNLTLTTNSESGATMYISGNNAGLFSSHANYTINAVSGNLAALPSGFGVQQVLAMQSSGGPLSASAPYNQGGDIVGITDQTMRSLFDTVAPIVGGSGAFRLKAKPSPIAPSASDYSETLTIVAAGRF